MPENPHEPNQPPPLTGGMHSRRRLLKTGAVLGLVGAGGFGLLYWDGDEPTTVTSVPDGIPQAAEFVAAGETATLLSDRAFHGAIDEELDTQGVQSVADLDEVLDSVAERTGIEPRSVETTTVFGATTGPASGVGGVILEAEADGIEELLAETGVLAEETEYGGYELYVIEIELPDVGAVVDSGLAESLELVVADLGDGEYAVGTRREIEGVIEVRAGDRPDINDALGRAVESADPGDLRFGFLVPDNLFEVLGVPAAARLIDPEEFDYGFGSVDGGELSLSVRATSATAAGDLGRQIDGLSTLLGAGDSSEFVDLPPEMEGQLLDVAADIEVETDRRRVDVTVSDGYRLAAVVLVSLFGELDL